MAALVTIILVALCWFLMLNGQVIPGLIVAGIGLVVVIPREGKAREKVFPDEETQSNVGGAVVGLGLVALFGGMILAAWMSG